MRIFYVLIFSVLLAACATQAPREVRTGEIYQRHAAEEESTSVRFATLRSWRRAGDDAILIEFDRGRHYLFELSATCRTEIHFAHAIRLITASPQRVDRFDRMQVGSSVCRILSIREVDWEAVQADLERLRHVEDQPSGSIDTDVIHADDYSGGT